MSSKKILLQINVTANWGSTGKIAEQIGLLAMQQGWESYIAYGRMMNPSKSKLIKIGSQLDVYLHYVLSRFFDMEGLASRRATRKLVKEIEKLKPSVVHLHNIHDHYLNYQILFEYLAIHDIPVVWTQHDCWAFTGGCAYYSMQGCDKWKKECVDCPSPISKILDRSNYQYNLRKKLLMALNNLALVPVSYWLEGELRQSFLGNKRIQTILNGVDINLFTPRPSTMIRQKYEIGNNRFLLAVASVWDRRKGLDDYVRLASVLDDNVKLVLVGLSRKQVKELPHNIIAVPRTQNIVELAQLYTEASIVLNLSREETFGLTTVEGFACGTPGIVYNCTASPELVTEETGCVVDAGDIEAVKKAIDTILRKDNISYVEVCRSRALTKYDKDVNYNKYLELYDDILLSRKQLS